MKNFLSKASLLLMFFAVALPVQQALAGAGVVLSSVSGGGVFHLGQEVSLEASVDEIATTDFSYTLNWADGSNDSGSFSSETPDFSLPTFTHIYDSEGDFAAELCVSDELNTDCQTVNFQIVEISMSPTPTTQEVNFSEVAIVNLNVIDIVTDTVEYSFDWADGIVETGSMASSDINSDLSHTYATEGTFTPEFCVDNGYMEVCASTEINVVRKPNLTLNIIAFDAETRVLSYQVENDSDASIEENEGGVITVTDTQTSENLSETAWSELPNQDFLTAQGVSTFETIAIPEGVFDVEICVANQSVEETTTIDNCDQAELGFDLAITELYFDQDLEKLIGKLNNLGSLSVPAFTDVFTSLSLNGVETSLEDLATTTDGAEFEASSNYDLLYELGNLENGPYTATVCADSTDALFFEISEENNCQTVEFSISAHGGGNGHSTDNNNDSNTGSNGTGSNGDQSVILVEDGSTDTGTCAHTFVDVDKANSLVSWFFCNDVIHGMSNDGVYGVYYEPNRNISRAEGFVIISRSFGLITGAIDQVSAPSEDPYTDLAHTHWSAPYTDSLKETGALPTDETTIRPNDEMQLGELEEVLSVTTGETVDFEGENTDKITRLGFLDLIKEALDLLSQPAA